MALAARWLRTVVEIALRAVGPKQVQAAASEALARQGFPFARGEYILAGLGKAATAQIAAWLEEHPEPLDYRIFAPRGYGSDRHNLIRGNHPLPGPESFRAGRALREWIETLPPGRPALVFTSGGASAAVEDPAPEYTAAEITAATEELLHRGLPIETLNPIRAQWSSLKVGGALRLLDARPLAHVVHSDVPPGLEMWVASGPFESGPFPVPDQARHVFRELFPDRSWRSLDAVEPRDDVLRILAGSNALALQTAAHVAEREGLTVRTYPETLNGDAVEVGRKIAAVAMAAPEDLLLFGGEPTVRLGAQSGNGGRLGTVALAYGLAAWDRPALPLIAAASDGQDGASAFAGVFWLPGPFDRELAVHALEHYDADRFFRRMRRGLKLPPTGANVRDIVAVLVHPEKIRAA